MKTVIVHGHFYQPPRENPWTGVIEDQPSAVPYDNWNQRIQEECYQANGWSPVHNGRGKIHRIYNNYEHISFNFGPTLLSWLKENARETYDKIREGDRDSIPHNNGYGNALAQVYNHMIMPLASEKDRLTQIEWGIRDFQCHFNRDPEGMWLAETAINPDTADELVRAGIRYTVLSPWQAAGYTLRGEDPRSADNDPLLWQHSWTLPCPSGDLRIFFYHPGLSSDISFQHLLRDADHFYSRVKSEFSYTDSQQLPIATDGEIYGHHEKLGNMGLSAFLSKVQDDEEIEISNFASLMNRVPPAGEAVLRRGEDNRGSSWSCSHGVSRWYKDCGCNTGGKEGWNQSWRTALREGLDRLSDETDRTYEMAMSRLTGKDPWEIRNKYIEVLLNPSEADSFYKEYGSGKKSPSDKRLFFKLLEGQKNKMFMFTSCGWFFSDISGIEPIQNLMYAARVIALYDSFYSVSPEKAFLEYLSDAESNEPAKGNGAVLYTSRKFEVKKGLFKLAASLILRRFYDLADETGQAGFFNITNYECEKRGENLYTGRFSMNNIFTRALRSYRFEIILDKKLFSRITLIFQNKSLILYPEDLPLPLKKDLMKKLSISRDISSRAISERFCDMVSQLNEMMQLSTPDDHSFKESVQALLYYTLREITYMMEKDIEGSWESFQTIITTAARWEIPLPSEMSIWLRELLDRGIENWQKKEIHQREEWANVYSELKALLNSSSRIPGTSITPTQTGMICSALFLSEEGRNILEIHQGDGLTEEIFQTLNLSPDFHMNGVSEKGKS